MKKIILFFMAILVAVLAAGYLYLTVHSISSGDDCRPGDQEIQSLQGNTISMEASVTRFGKARKEKRGGNIILYVTGTPYEMGYQHGMLLREEIRKGVVPVFADPVSSMPDYQEKPSWFRFIILKYLELKVYAPIEDHTPIQYLQELKGIADGSGIDYRTIFIANFLSDLNMVMIPELINRKAKEAGVSLSCSSLAVTGSATADGTLLFGRNTDYSGQGRWAANQVIIFYEPEGGNRYVNISTAGMIKCNSAMNEKGIVIGGHFMGFSGASIEGLSFTVLENEIMRRSGTLEEALEIVKKSKRGGGFGFVIADGNGGTAKGIEATLDLMGVRNMKNDSMIMTNFALTPELEKADLLARYGLMMRNIQGRYIRLGDLVEENYGRITPALAAEFMSDRMDVVSGMERGTGNTICNQTNVTSVVFQPKTGYFWVAAGKEPVCGNEYVRFDFHEEFKGNRSTNHSETLAGYRWKNDLCLKGMDHYMKAIIAYKENHQNKPVVLSHLQSSLDADPYEPIYYKDTARIMIHEGKYEKALELLSRSLAFIKTNNERAQAFLLMGQVYDLAGSRDKAVAMYQKAVEVKQTSGNDHTSRLNHFVYAYANKYLAVPFVKKDINHIPILSEILD